MNKRAQKTILAAIGIVAAFAAAEAALRLSGYFYYGIRMTAEKRMTEKEDVFSRFLMQPEHRDRNDTSSVRVLCVGDSYTFGQGAPAGYSYPAHLQRICNEKTPSGYKIYNCGVPGYTSTKLRKSLGSLCSLYAPSILIVLIGLNDHCNPYATDILEMKSRKKDPSLLLWFRDLRTVKVFGYAALGIRKAFSRRPSEVDTESKEYKDIVSRGANLELEGDTESAETEFKKAIALDAYQGNAYLFLAHLYQSNAEPAKALETYRALLRAAPYASARTDLWRNLFLMYQFGKELKPEIAEIMASIPSDDHFVNPGRPFDLGQSSVIELYRENISFMADFARKRGMTMIVQTYPSYHEYLNDAIRAVARENGALLADNEAVWRKNPGYSSYRVKDGHPDARGYRIMAENVFSAIRAHQERETSWKK